MPEQGFSALLLLLAAAGMGWWFYRWFRHRIAVSRIPHLADQEQERRVSVPRLEHPLEVALPWITGFTALVLALLLIPLGTPFAFSVGFLFWVVGLIIRKTVSGRRILKIESQLAEGIDHMVTSLRAGVGVVDALGSAERDARRPLKPHLTQFVLRLRLGDDPGAVCREMAEVLKLESFRLFYYALGVQWEGGGSLAPTLATTARFIRDRVELGRRVRAQTTEARFSVLAILALTYFLAGLMWNMDPTRVTGFLETEIGQNLAAAAVFLQALGAAWISRMARIKY